MSQLPTPPVLSLQATIERGDRFMQEDINRIVLAYGEAVKEACIEAARATCVECADDIVMAIRSLDLGGPS